MALARILVVEDDPHIAHILRFQLEAAGYAVRTAENGREGYELVLAEPPDLVLTDLMMPVMDGHELCRRIKDDFRTAQIPVILLTAKAEVGDKVAAFDLGANDYLVKPHNRDELLLRVRNLLNWSRTQREANPLTGLPGNLAIEREVLRRLDSHTPFVFLYIDADNFKAFNDYYGYARGDQAIQLVAKILRECATRLGVDNGFVGHIGGDDFVVLCGTADAENVGEAILEWFTEASAELYDREDRERGHIEVLNRRHVVERFPMMSLTIALVSTEKVPVSHLAELIDIAQELKAHGKGIAGSVLVNERRRRDDGPETERGAA